MDNPASQDFVGKAISDHTLEEREYCKDNYADKKYEKAMVAIAVVFASGVIFGLGKLVTDHFIGSFNAPSNIDTVYDGR